MTHGVNYSIGRIVQFFVALALLITAIMFIVGPEKFGSAVVTALALDQWYPPAVSASAADIHMASLILLVVCILLVAAYFLLWLIYQSMEGLNNGAGAEIVDMVYDTVADLINFVFRRALITKASTKALKYVADCYDEQGRFGSGMELKPTIGPDDLPGLMDRLKDEEHGRGKAGLVERDTDLVAQFSRDAVIEIVRGTDFRAEEISPFPSTVSLAAQRWAKDRDIHLDQNLGLTFIRPGTIHPVFISHAIATLNWSQILVLTLGSSTPSRVLSNREQLDTAAKALAVVREIYSDDEIPADRADIVEWALSIVSRRFSLPPDGGEK